MDTSGPHAHYEDDKHHLVDVWANTNGNVTFKVSNGRQWHPMWVVAHVTFNYAGNLIAKKDYHVYCQSPQPGGGGKENWFVFHGPGSIADNILVTTNKEAPWTAPSGGWEVTVSGSWPAP